MRPRLSRVRASEWGIGIESAALLVILFGAPWFRGALGPGWYSYPVLRLPTHTGWQSLQILGPLTLVVGVLGIGVWWLQATRRSPALPVVATAIETLLALALSVGLMIRVLIDHPAGIVGVRYGAYAGLVLALCVFTGCYRSLRVDGISLQDAPQQIELVSLGEESAAGGGR